MPGRINLIGQRFGKLTVIAEAPSVRISNKPCRRSSCLCDCGTQKEVFNNALQAGATRSCGCSANRFHPGERTQLKHGHAPKGHPTRTYRVWRHMLNRCENPNVPEYRYYGARGIKVCSEWHSFEAFLRDMGESPAELTLNRIDNDGDYTPSNCCWDTMTAQVRNRRNTLFIEVDGKKLSLPEACETFGVPYDRARQRLKRGWPANRVLST